MRLSQRAPRDWWGSDTPGETVEPLSFSLSLSLSLFYVRSFSPIRPIVSPLSLPIVCCPSVYCTCTSFPSSVRFSSSRFVNRFPRTLLRFSRATVAPLLRFASQRDFSNFTGQSYSIRRHADLDGSRKSNRYN